LKYALPLHFVLLLAVTGMTFRTSLVSGRDLHFIAFLTKRFPQLTSTWIFPPSLALQKKWMHVSMDLQQSLTFVSVVALALLMDWPLK
jgi:hypothetical protein